MTTTVKAAVVAPTEVRALVAPVIAVGSAPVAHPRGLDALAARASEPGIISRKILAKVAVVVSADVFALIAAVLAVRDAAVTLPQCLDQSLEFRTFMKWTFIAYNTMSTP